ncbi:GTPase IMAP family member 8-like isoform X2 [Alosa pseudoharengus]
MSEEKHQRQHALRVVLLGGSQSGKTSVINTVLSQEPGGGGERHAGCLKREGDISGRRVTLIDTRGWWTGYLLTDTAELMKQDLVLSVCLCAPGPHAFLLTVETDAPFTERNRKVVEQHLGLFGENIWRHTIVVFTRGDSLKGKSIEQHIESQGVALKWVIQKCENRYHVVDNHSKDTDQVIELLKKLVAVNLANSGSYFQIDMETLKEVEEKKAAVKVRAKSRQDCITEQRQMLQQQGEVKPLTEMRIVLLGWVSSGKSSVRKTILDGEELVTRNITVQSNKKSGKVEGRCVTVIDTPGWWKYFPAKNTPDSVKTELKKSLTLGSKHPHAFLLVVPADVSFLEDQRKIIEDNMKIFGEQVWRHTLILFTWGDQLGGTRIEEHIESEGEPLRWLVEKCGNRYHVFDNKNRGDGSQVRELLEKVEEMVAGNSLYSLSTEEWKNKSKETDEEPDGAKMEVVNPLDHEWKRLDRQLEEKINNMWKQMIDPELKGNQSGADRPD